MSAEPDAPRDPRATVDSLEEAVVDVEAAAAGEATASAEDTADVPGSPEPPD